MCDSAEVAAGYLHCNIHELTKATVTILHLQQMEGVLFSLFLTFMLVLCFNA